MLRCVKVCCRALEYVVVRAVHCSVYFDAKSASFVLAIAGAFHLQCVAVSVLQCVAVCCGVLRCVAVYSGVLQCVAT